MPKIKTRKSALKRFRKTVTGKFMRKKAFKAHLLEKKSAKRKKNLSRRMFVFKGDAIALRSMIPYLRKNNEKIEQRPANITYTQAGVSCFVGQESDKFKVQFFVGSSVVKSLPAYS